ncbi:MULTISPECIES: ABC transporter substrate-binding protein [Streptomyces]|uniref:Sugar ABC transporter substrate-binding protein n=1 Tax=Streptomyces thermoviolaceus subsp. thermoviolaceus TaxID=66860 RepID=A0ABX0YPB8_STRTL|nr:MULTISPECIES: sugar ABC transporter substrate-binding protein [Streptomyces]MCM3265822.1 sugar ABC transporter substrate-binding protein [Streptomyces thermoviolaceus]NJP14395.1 sugar ABC transporter substrate-binding protein [Streptomyces thermoviolaceus subsp. thermoviolaceus]RSS06586.1 sugar ABC transporter substrate-binding protein [Streptomyces sp. WAC00469]WTD49728.1 sugar ABC transporter substrate-binding protein [Streptomyces thermoviolaceus]GGV81301.1 sugar ABC transporter substrat
MRTQSRRRPPRATLALAAAGTLLAPLLSGCWVGAGGAGSGGDSINVLMVNNPQMVELQKLTAAHFTKETGIKVNFTVLPENDVRDKISQDFANQAGQYDVATLSNYEIPIYARNGWLHPLDDYVAEDKDFDQQDVLEPMRESLTGDDGKLYGEPFYGESSFLMYRKDVFAAKGLTMPAHPTWQQVADLAAKVDGARPGMRGICLRGLPGWGELMAPLTTVVNTFGGTWFDKDWKAHLDSPEFVRATKFYVDLVRAHGESGAAQSGFAECLNNLTQGKVAMWYDATSAAGSLEAKGSPVKGKIGYVPAPVERTESSGWLYTWAWGIQKASRNADKAWTFVSWASSKEYEELVGEEFGWSDVPAGKRASTYDNPAYRKEAAAFQEQTKQAIASARPNDPGVQPRPAPGIQFVDIPEFTDLGTKVSQEISAAIAGRQSVETALKKSQKLAAKISKEYEGR